MRNKFDLGDTAEYLDDLGRYRDTERALTAAADKMYHKSDTVIKPFVVRDNNMGSLYGPFESYAEALKWALAMTRNFDIVTMRKP